MFSEARNLPDGNIEDSSLGTLELELLVLPGGPDVSAPVELGAVRGVGEIAHCGAAELGSDGWDEGQQEGGDDDGGGGGGGGGEYHGSSHGQVWLQEMPKSDWRARPRPK